MFQPSGIANEYYTKSEEEEKRRRGDVLLTRYPSHRQKKGGGAEKAHPEIPEFLLLVCTFVATIFSPERMKNKGEKEARKRRIRVERTT